jgi:hypothetical protein
MAQEQVIIAQADIHAPGYDDPTVVAYRAGDIVHPAWAEQHAAYLKEAAQDGTELIKTVSPAKAGEASQKAMEQSSTRPQTVQPSATQPSGTPG